MKEIKADDCLDSEKCKYREVWNRCYPECPDYIKDNRKTKEEKKWTQETDILHNRQTRN